MKSYCFLVCLLLLICCTDNGKKKDHQIIEVQKATVSPTLDGKANENCWNAAQWHPLDQNWVGEAYSYEDFNGRYKLTWDTDALYILVEITDDVLYDQKEDPFKFWWDDDCVEVFVDENNSGGLHQFSHNAFAYHIALDGKVVDLAPDREPRLFNEHVVSKRVTKGTTSTWEIAVKLFDDSYMDGKTNIPKKLFKEKKVGFGLAYCDNDGSKERENFIGSVFIAGEDKNRGWIDADVFGTLVLKE
ncbi:sugar-binding protein [Costertonia aggregata]|uniref:CBM9 family sugar-binding protein n=1 Tax=Costertonia aggregata TaxID=343403 RepID=A0A7H9ASC5_9FLAO|nr:sugar-binding protein [Costertonia aggregata]QLG46353.1 CBM9 family sugar-binding protein [Costertonia aggregata]